MQKLQKEFFMDKSNLEFEDLEKICREVISRVLHTCELELLNNNDEVKSSTIRCNGCERIYLDIFWP